MTKEFWIAQGSHADIVCYSETQAKLLGWSKPYIHVKEVDPGAESEIRELREKLGVAEEALKHISSDHPVCPGCISEDVSLSEHYTFEASEALSRIRGGSNG